MKTLGKTTLSLADGNDVTITVSEGTCGNDYNVHMNFSEDWFEKKNGAKRITLNELKPGVIIERTVYNRFKPSSKPLTYFVLVLSDPIEVPDSINPDETTHIVIYVTVEKTPNGYRHVGSINRSFFKDIVGYDPWSTGKVVDYHDFTSGLVTWISPL